ncbi:MAG: SDR family oxidoreductase [Pseudomonadota bacterium]
MSQATQGVTLVTGGNRGIGLAITQTILEEGGEVVCVSRQAPELQHERLHSVVVDLGDREETKQAVGEINANHQVLNIVHNAGVIRPALIEDVALTDLDYLTELHLATMVTLVQASLPAMKDAGYGRIVGISSRGALGLQTRTNYAATKAGMFGMLRTWALELGPSGITSNCVAPGPVVTDMFDEIMGDDEQRVNALAGSIPVRRLGAADDIAHATRFFLSPAAGFVTGQVLYVCGGASIGTVVI